MVSVKQYIVNETKELNKKQVRILNNNAFLSDREVDGYIPLAIDSSISHISDECVSYIKNNVLFSVVYQNDFSFDEEINCEISYLAIRNSLQDEFLSKVDLSKAKLKLIRKEVNELVVYEFYEFIP